MPADLPQVLGSRFLPGVATTLKAFTKPLQAQRPFAFPPLNATLLLYGLRLRSRLLEATSDTGPPEAVEGGGSLDLVRNGLRERFRSCEVLDTCGFSPPDGRGLRDRRRFEAGSSRFIDCSL